MIEIERIVNSGLQVNTYIIYEKKKSLIIDPGSDYLKIIQFIDKNNLKPEYIFLTHGHYDHFEGLFFLTEKYKTDFFIHKNDEELYYNENNIGANNIKKPKITKYFDINKFELFSEPLSIIHTPGHTKGSVCFYINNYLFSGDTLFYGTVGRTDLPGGNFEHLIKSIKEKLLILPEETIVFPGHMESTTIEFEKENNPYLQ